MAAKTNDIKKMPDTSAAAKEVVYIYSTLACDQKYTEWQRGGGDMSERGRTVLVKGGTGVADKRIVTPLGVATKISREDAAFLQSNPLFRLHEKNGYLVIRSSKEDPEKVAADMSLDDPSSPKTPADYADAAGAQAKIRE